ncbi:hypothetical protein CK203_109862 [Vitis vinifera]|uniref:Uncharacterized protein n=1 Tax=Vitis vinifera TaxID=29760 RepID=A0A438C567_VITVI|nr:hypothetical protein CK203_109862 [Vitis vinifera]
MIVHSLPDQANFLSLCFPEETTDCGVDIEPTGLIDGVVPCDEVFAIEVVKEIQTVLTPDLMEDVTVGDDEFDDTFGFIKGASNFVDPPLLFDILSRFISRSDDVYDFILDIDDEITQPDSDRDFSGHESDPIDEKFHQLQGMLRLLILAQRISLES